MSAGVDAATDVLTAGDDDARPRRWPRVLLVLLLLAGGAGVGLEQDRQRQRAALVDAAVDAEQVVGAARTSLAGLVSYTSATLSQPGLAPEQRQALLATFARDAQRFVPRMRSRRAAVAEVRVLPWDDALRDARTAYLARVDGWTALVESSVDDPQSLLLERRHTREARERASAALAAVGEPADVAEVTALLSR